MTLLAMADALGIFVFALSGGLAASRQKMDLFGTIVVALLPAIGGGTLRDLLLDRPVFWLEAPYVLLIAAVAGALTWFVGERIARFKTLVWLDAMGLALFAVVGAQTAYAAGYGPIITIVMGTITASFGGLIRDIVCNEVPLILREDIYATAALAGAGLFWTLSALGISEPIAFALGGLSTFGIRAGVLVARHIQPAARKG